MEKSFWLKKWEENEIGFHYQDFNDLLTAHIGKFNLKNSNIFVPLCGKSLDLIYLSQLGKQVIGVELSEKAIKSFFAENKLGFETRSDGPFKRYSCKELKIDIFQGDFFELNPDNIGKVDFIYDRASMIALPLDMRISYSKVIGNIAHKNCQILLITTEYDYPELIGPPFSVTEAEVRDLYSNNFEITVLERLEKGIENQRFIELGVKNPARVVFKLIRK
jgi:thiopurine S-methyltransferase